MPGNEALDKCIKTLQASKNDTERMASLFLVTKLIKSSKDLKLKEKQLLFQAIDYKFLVRLLKSPSSEDCPAIFYKSVALSVCSAFLVEPVIAENNEIIESAPEFLKIIEDADNSDEDDESDELLMVISEAYKCLKSIAGSEKGKKGLVKNGCITRLAELYTKGAFKSEDGLEIIRIVGSSLGPQIWDNGGSSNNGPEIFNELMEHLSSNFESDQSEVKFELCETIAGVLITYAKPASVKDIDESFLIWSKAILKGLMDILTSKLTDKQRNPALKLTSILFSELGIDALLKSCEDPAKINQFLVLLVHLSCIEIRMGLEDRKIDVIVANDQLIGSCYCIIETMIRFISSIYFEKLEEKQKEQVYHSLKGAFTAIISFIHVLRKESERNAHFWDARKKLLACASIRCLAVWLAMESSSMRDEVYNQLPFILRLTFEAFEDEEMNQSTESMVLAETGKAIEPLIPDSLCMFLPALCHLTSQERGIKILLEAKGEDLLFRFITHNWMVYKNLKELQEKASRPKKPRKGKDGKEIQSKATGGNEPEMNIRDIELNLTKLRVALNNVCNLFINLIVLDPELASASSKIQQIMRWSFSSLPSISNSPEEVPLLANVSALGLLLLSHMIKKVKDAQAEGIPLSPEDEFVSARLISGNDNSVFRFGQAVIRFVWDAHLPDNSQSPITLVLTSSYRAVWSDIKEMWFLSLQTVGTLMESLPWLAEFAVESGFLETIIDNLSKCYKSSIDASTLSCYEDFFCSVLKSTPNAMKIVQTKGSRLATSHHLLTLGKALKGDVDVIEKIAE